VLTGPGSPTVPTHVSRFWTDADGQKFGTALQPNLSRNPHHLQSWDHVCCCWYLLCPPYRSNGWWHDVLTGPGSPTVPTHVSRFWTDADGQKFGTRL
jgi:hypothetical protein